MSGSPDQSIAQLEDQLDGASRTLSRLDALNALQAARVAARMDRLASRLLEVSPPPATEAVHQRLGTTPASSEDVVSVASRGTPVARMAPVAAAARVQRLVDQGLMSWPGGPTNVPDDVSALVTGDGPPISQQVVEDRR